MQCVSEGRRKRKEWGEVMVEARKGCIEPGTQEKDQKEAEMEGVGDRTACECIVGQEEMSSSTEAQMKWYRCSSCKFLK